MLTNAQIYEIVRKTSVEYDYESILNRDDKSYRFSMGLCRYFDITTTLTSGEKISVLNFIKKYGYITRPINQYWFRQGDVCNRAKLLRKVLFNYEKHTIANANLRNWLKFYSLIGIGLGLATVLIAILIYIVHLFI